MGLSAEYYPLDSFLGRPTGAFAEVTRSTLGTGLNASPSIRPPGFINGRHSYHQERGHLIANNHGGSGKDARNLVSIDGTNHLGMTKHENKVTRHVNAGNTVLIEVKPNYIGNNLIPDSISMYAIDQDARVIVDTTMQKNL